MQKYLIFFLCLFFVFPACKEEGPVSGSGKFISTLRTDKSRYEPGETARIFLTLNRLDLDEIVLTYRYLTTQVGEERVAPSGDQLEISWQPPADDFRGYAVEIKVYQEGEVVEKASTAVDVSSDWTRFPRYGFLSDFSELSSTQINNILSRLNRYHINGLQYYDWHYKHHRPLSMLGGSPAASWQDIARRDISFQTVKTYIDRARGFNMASMSYNLIFGVWEDYATDGVSAEWLLYNDANHQDVNKHELDDNWAQSDILLANPANSAWQDYLFKKTDTIYQHLDFDGWHMDQLGDRGGLYDYAGNRIVLRNTYEAFLQNLASEFPDKKAVLNGVNQYGQPQILGSGVVDFAYSEVWFPNESYEQLVRIITNNGAYSNQNANSVLAAYMNYDLADNPGEFNTPAVLMTDAVIMAFGGSHLELGEHMLGKEYFPNNNLSMSPQLEDQLLEYYDFLVAYQNILRDGGSLELQPQLSSPELDLTGWGPQLGKVSVIRRDVQGMQVFHLLNFDGLQHLDWRDSQGTQTAPKTWQNASLSFPADQISRVVFASPDWQDGVQQALDFTVENGMCTVTIPSLSYWGMLMVE